ncbi:hypothetical protein ACFSKL_11005 [Belliella marina]|uniref:DUF7507 domain-containing protein n=1 Tax=Belliella marina TaxID=1644146 RepID=A0ABW4VM99_9BACT
MKIRIDRFLVEDNVLRLLAIHFLMLSVLFLQIPSLIAQNDNRVPFRHKVGNPAPAGNLFRIKGDFSIIGNSNLTLVNYTDTTDNSANSVKFIDIDGDYRTFNSSAATLQFSEENNADPNCSEILYAGLYWSGRVGLDKGLDFELSQNIKPGIPKTINGEEQIIGYFDEINYLDQFLSISENYDNQGEGFPVFSFYYLDDGMVFQYQIKFTSEIGNEVQYSINDGDWISVENLSVAKTDTVYTATFKPIVFEFGGVEFSVGKLSRLEFNPSNYALSDHSFLHMVTNGVHTPMLEHTVHFDKRKVKLKGPSETEYTEITADGNAILYPLDELANIFVGYSDVTDYVKRNGLGEYTVADIALEEGQGDNVGFYGHWGIIVVYQNSKMDWRDVTIFDGYSFVQSLNGQEHVGEVEIEGFGAVKSGQVDLKLGLMAGEGDRSIGGDFLEIINKDGEWVRLSHPKNTPENFFNSTIYTPVRNSLGNVVPTPRNPEFSNNIGVDIVQWDISNPSNSIIANDQTSTRFRFGTRQDLYTIYAFAFSVLSYVPEVQVLNQVEGIDGMPLGDDPVIEPGQEITFLAEIRNKGSEEVSDTKIVIPIPYTATFVSASTIPANYGNVTFDPDMGIGGSIIWDLGDLPLLADVNEVLASLKYTLKITEDCAILANTSCEASISMTGNVSGIGKVSQNVFTDLPFVSGIREGECVGEEIFEPLNIPIVGRAEFALQNCPDFEDFSSLKGIVLPVFCHRDTPVGLSDFITPTKEGYSIYFFSQEIGGNALTEYFVNTSVVGTEKIWVSEGPADACLGIRTPITLEVIAKSPMPVSYDITGCLGGDPIAYAVSFHEGYVLNYYLDDNPISKPLNSVPFVSPSEDGTFSVWVSQFKEGECESNRKKVEIRVFDCSLISDIKVTIVPSIEIYDYEGQVVTYFVIVENTGGLELTNVFVTEYLRGNDWRIPYMAPGEKLEYSFQYSISEENMIVGAVEANAYASGGSLNNGFIDDSDKATIFKLPLEFMDYIVTTTPASCVVGNGESGAIYVEFLKGPQVGYFEIRDLQDNQLMRQFFYDSNVVKIDLLPGEYKLILTTAMGFEIQESEVFTVKDKESVNFSIDEEVFSCIDYSFYPSSNEELVYEVVASNGSRILLNSDQMFVFSKSDSYKIVGKDPAGIKCAVEKTMDVVIQEPIQLNLQFSSFCQNDLFTNVTLLNDVDENSVKWYKVDNLLVDPLVEFDGNLSLMVEQAGDYMVTLTNADGCVIGKREFELKRTFSDPPKLGAVYSICPTKEGSQTISIDRQFVENHWYLDGQELSQDLVLSPTEEGLYRLVAKDQSGCEFIMDFEVEIKCEPTLRYSNAIRPGEAGHGLIIYPDNLIEEIEIQIFNRWGELIFFCQDKNLRYREKSTCFWDGLINGKPAIIGNYSLVIQYKVKGEDFVNVMHDMLFILN